MRPEYFEVDHSFESTDPMTLKGTVQKLVILLAILIGSAAFGWAFPVMPLAIGSALVAFVLAIVLAFKKDLAPYLAPVYAVFSGFFVGAISVISNEMLKDTQIGHAGVPIAVMGTMITLGIMLFLYAKRIIKVTQTMKSVIIGATLGIAFTYLATFAISFFAPTWVSGLAIYGSGPIGIGFSIFVIGLAAFNFLLDFDLIETGITHRAPKHMEWYAAFGTLVTIVWLYLEILRLLRKLSRN